MLVRLAAIRPATQWQRSTLSNSTAGLVKNIKALAGDLSEANRQACAETTKPLVEAVEALTTFASSPQFASTPAKISAQAKQTQEPITLVCSQQYNWTTGSVCGFCLHKINMQVI